MTSLGPCDLVSSGDPFTQRLSFFVTSNIRDESLCHFELNHLVNVLSTRDSSRVLRSTYSFVKALHLTRGLIKLTRGLGKKEPRGNVMVLRSFNSKP